MTKRYMMIAFVILVCCMGCIAIPLPLEESITEMHKGTIVIAEDYISLAVKCYEGEILQNKLQLLEKHLQHSEQLYKYVKDRGGKIGWPWAGVKED